MASEQVLPPPAMWAQRKNLVSLTLNLEDCKAPVITVEPTKVYFKGTGGPDKKLHEVTIELFNEIDTEESKYSVRDRSIEFFLKKKEEGPYWPSLMKDKKKVHWLKIDFNRWRDEDDSEPEDGGEPEQDLDEMMRRMGGLNGPGGQLDLNDLGGSDEEDEDDMPDLE